MTLKSASHKLPLVDSIHDSYAQIAAGLLDGLSGLCLLDAAMQTRGESGALTGAAAAAWLDRLGWPEQAELSPVATSLSRGQWATAMPLADSAGQLLGVLCAQQARPGLPPNPTAYAQDIQRRLRPLLDCVHRELATTPVSRSRLHSLTERTAELEWLFDMTTRSRAASGEPCVLKALINESVQRLGAGYGALWVPDKRVLIERSSGTTAGESLRATWEGTRQHLLTWVQRQKRPLLVNGGARSPGQVGRAKMLCSPMLKRGGQVAGVLAFFNPNEAADFSQRHVFVARHLGRQAMSLLETQFDLMTGLYTRDGLDQAYAQVCGVEGDADRSVLYIDVDHMHVVNELHGFEVGNEVIARIADLLAPPLLPEGCLAARIAADRFAIVLPGADTRNSAEIADELRHTVSRLPIGPAGSAVELSISCGVATLVAMPQGLDRAIAAAELACKTAKTRGRDRTERYSADDNSMMRRHRDAIAVGDLRTALRDDRLVLFAQRIAPLRNPGLPGGYEILLRMRGDDGQALPPGPLIEAATRYQLLPTIDRWVSQRALQMLAPYARMLGSRGISMSINVSGQSIGDSSFVGHLAQQLKEARLPGDCVNIEITEQAAVTNFAKANQMIRALINLGCSIALDDFGTGANTLIYLKNLQVSRVKIDGGFVRDAASNRSSRAAVRAIVELATEMSIDTVAEYVETAEIAADMRSLGVDYAQGHAFGEPEPLDALLTTLDADESRRLHRLFLET
ncbi:MAG: GGDEF domain-containing protein [Steroidobacteraceae bacterium]|nr:GGDEF domain-containing protein [Steroidobacteraceae bacterium]